jgi:hypothetical protein
VLTGDVVNLDVTNAQFANKSVGTAKTVTANLALSGAKAGSYRLGSATGTTTANITPKPLTGSFTADDKTTTATPTPPSLAASSPAGSLVTRSA